MKKIIDIAGIEAREKELVEELGNLRRIKKYALKYGIDAPSTTPKRQETVGLGDTIVSALTQQIDVTKALREIISSFGDASFNIQDVEKALEKTESQYSRSAVFGGILTLKNSDEIKIVQEGAGRRPAEYQVTPKFNSRE